MITCFCHRWKPRCGSDWNSRWKDGRCKKSIENEGWKSLETRILRENKHCNHFAIASMASHNVRQVFHDVNVTSKDLLRSKIKKMRILGSFQLRICMIFSQSWLAEFDSDKTWINLEIEIDELFGSKWHTGSHFISEIQSCNSLWMDMQRSTTEDFTGWLCSIYSDV
jgi:hypothetical protein